jgi:autotransporter-associated beta strand protein
MFLEQLENRSLLAVMVWDGSASNAWSNPANWVGDVAPMAGDDLVFPASAISYASNNDLPAGTRFNTLLLQGGGYSITGNAIELAGGLTANQTSGTNTVGLELSLINAQTIMSANAGTALLLSGAIHTGNLLGTTQIFGTSALTFDGAGATAVLGSIDGQGSLSKLGSGTLTLAGANAYQGITDVRQGVINVQNPLGLGSATTGDTQIQAGAALHVSGGIAIAENFAIREGGIGFGNGTDGSTLGALRSIGGTNTLTGNLDLAGGNNLIGVDAGSSLIISGTIVNALSAANRLIKTGGGTLQIAGSQDNLYRGETRVLAGTLELNKTAGRNAIGGNLVIGDNLGGDNAAVVRLLASDQIPQLDYYQLNVNSVTLESSGVLDFNGFSDAIGNLVLRTGTTYSSDVMTGAGVLELGGNLTVQTFQGSSGATPPATISGNLNLGTFFSGGAAGTALGVTRRFAVQDTQNPNIATDLILSANITGSSDVSITQTDGGTIRLTGNNAAWAGEYLVQSAGTIEVGSNTALGSGLFSPQNNAVVLRAFGGSRTLANTISLDSNLTFLGDDALPGSENFTLSGAVTLTGDRTLLTMDPTQTVTLAGPVGEGIFGSRVLNKSGRGTLEMTAVNTYSGSTTVNDDSGTLVLRGNATLPNLSGLTVGVGSTLRIDNNSGGNVADRLNDAMPITLNGGRLHFVAASGSNSSEYVGTVTAAANYGSTVELENTSSGAFSSVLTANTFNLGSDRTVNFVGTGVPLSSAGANRLSFVNHPGNLTNAMLNAGRVTSGSTVELATLEPSLEGVAVVAYPTAGYITDIQQANAASNVRITTPGVYNLTTSKVINSLILGPGVTLAGTGVTLTVGSGSLLFLGNGASSISVENLNLGNGSLYVDEGYSATINSNISGSQINKAGLGRLTLTGDNQHNGVTVVSEGVLNIQRSTALGSTASGTTVRANASLELQQTTFGPLQIGNEALAVGGKGSFTSNIGALRNVAGNNSWVGNVALSAPNINLLDTYGGFGSAGVSNTAAAFVDVASGTTLTLTGDFTGSDVAKIGGGTLELGGVFPRGQDRNNRIFAGTMLLNNEPGVQASRGRFFVGSDVPGAPAATLQLGASNQIIDDRRVEVLASGLFDLNGNSEVIGESNLILHVGPTGAARVNIGTGGTLYTNADIQVWGSGVANPQGAQITGGTLALTLPGVAGANTARSWQVNDVANGVDLNVSAAIVNGSGLQSIGVTKNGFGTLVFSGSTPNTYTGDTTLNEGTLILDKGSGSGGVNALAGRVFVGDNNPQSGFAGSDILRLAQPHQLPDYLAPVDIRTTGRWELAGNAETIGQADAQTALTLRAASSVDMGGGTLSIIGNIATNASEGASIWTPVTGTRIENGTLNLGNVPTVFDVPDRSELPFELEVSANIVGTAGLVLQNGGTLLLSGDNSGLSGDVIRTNGNFAIGSDSGFGTGRVLINAGNLTTFYGKRTIPNEFVFAGGNYNSPIALLGGNGTASSSTIGGGGNDLTFAGPVNYTAGNALLSVAIAGQVEFAGGLGETLGAAFLRKHGFGTLIFSSTVTLSGGFEIGQDSGSTGAGFVRASGGTVVLRGGGSYLNSNMTLGYGGTLQVDNSTSWLSNRLGDTALIDLAGGNLALVGNGIEKVGESFGQLRVRNNGTSSQVHALLPTGSLTPSTWRFSSFGVETLANGSSVRFVGRGVDLAATGPNQVGFNALPNLADGIIPQAVWSGSTGLEFLTVTNASPATSPFDNFVGSLTSGPNFATTLTGATATTNVKLSASEAIAGAVTANALLLANGTVNVTGGGSLIIDSGLLASTGVGATIAVATLTQAGNGIVFVDGVNSTLAISSAIGGASSNLAKSGSGLLTLSGNNSFAGSMSISDGVLRADSNTAFGTTAGNVAITYGATLELNGVNVPAEQLNIAGNGESNLGAVGLRTYGNNVWQGDVVLGHNRTAIEATAGSVLVIGTPATPGVVSGQGLNKTGAGTLELAGTANNTFVQSSILWQGTTLLNKPAGVNALPVLNDNTEFFVGNFYGSDDSVVVRSLASNQIGDGPYRFRIMSTGLFDLNGQSETLIGRTGAGFNHDALGLDISSAGSGDIDLNGGTLRIGNTVSENGRVQIRVLSGGLPAAATISDGTFELMGATGGQPRRILVDDSAAFEDLVITATIADGGAVSSNFIKNNNGRLVLAPTAVGGNTYTASTTIEGGEILVRHASALGAIGNGTQVNSGLSLLIEGVSLAEPLNINGTGLNGQGAIHNIAGNNTLSGAVTLAGTANIAVDAGQVLNISSVIGGGGNGITKLMPGTLRFSGTGANTYTGTTTVSEGVLELGKSAGVNAIAGPLTIGNDNGVQNADEVRLLANDQIANGAQVQVTPSGHFNLNGFNETIGNAAQTGLNFFLGVTTGPQVSTGAGVLTLGSGLGVQTQIAGGILNNGFNVPTVTTQSPSATITGNLNLGGVSHNLNAGDVGLNVRELHLAATISNGALSSSGSGIAYLSGNNTYAGGTTVTAGNLGVGSNTALGSGTLTFGTNANNTISLFATDYLGGPTATFSLANNVVLNAVAANNTTLNIRGDDHLVLNGSLTNNLNNSTIQGALEAGATLTLAGTINLSNDGTSRTLTIGNTTFGGGVNNSVAGGTVSVTGQIVNGGSSTASNLAKSGSGLLLLANNANSYGGTTTVNAGVLLITAANALGANGSLTTNQTTVANGATLSIAAGLIVPEWIVANNNGFGNLGAIRLLDNLVGVTETATISGNVNFNATTFVGVDGGGPAADRLVFTGILASGGGQMTKVGLGEMEVAGASDNGVAFPGAPSPWDDGLHVRSGTLYLNKAGSARVISGGTITVGDGGGPANSDRLILIGTGTDQLGGNLNVDVNASGLFSLAGTATEQIGQLQLFRLGGIAGAADSGAGTLTITANLFASNAGLTTGATPAATVAGNLNLGGANRNFSARDSYVLSPNDDLIVSALISNGGVVSNEYGTTVLTNPGNSYAGGTSVNGFALDSTFAHTHGMATLVGSTLIVRGDGALGTGNVAANAGGTLILDNSTVIANRIADAATLTIANGRVSMVGNAVASTEVIGTLTINAGSDGGQHGQLEVDSTLGGQTVLQASALTRGTGGVVNFAGVGANLGTGNPSQVVITGGTNPFTNDAIPWATVTGPAGFDLATDSDGVPASAPFSLGRFTSYSNDINAGTHVRLNGGVHVLTADRTVDTLILENGATVTGPFTLTLGTVTAGMIVVRSGSSTISTTGSAGNPGVQFAGREPLFIVEGTASLLVSSTLNSTATARKEGTGTLTLTGDNDVAAGRQLTGAFVVNAGSLVVRNENALGSEPGGTFTVNRRAELVLDTTAAPLALGNKALSLRGFGLADSGDGALRLVGTNGATWGTGTTAIDWGATTFVNVNAGNSLFLNGTIGGGANGVTKVGSGTLRLGGTGDNSNTGSVTINAGTVSLEKSGTNRAIRGAVVINDLGNFDAPGGSLVYGAGGTNQIDNGVGLTIQQDGTLDLAGQSDSVGTIALNGGTILTGSGRLTATGAMTLSGGSITGNLVLNNNVTYTSGLATNGLPVVISGTLDLGGAVRVFTINDGYAINDVIVDAVVSNGRMIKNGAGGLLLNHGANSFLPGVNEVQRIVIAGATGGTSQFTITFNGKTTSTIAVGLSDAATLANLQAALDALPNVGSGVAVVSNPAVGQFDITFTGHLGEADLPNQLTTTVVTGPGSFTPSSPTAGSAGVRLDSGILSLGSNTALGTARLHLNGSAQLIAFGGDRTLGNAVTLNPNITVTFGGRRDFGGTSDLALQGNITLVGAASAQVVNLDVIDNQSEVAWNGVVSGGGDLLVPTKRGVGRLTLAGDNTFDVRDSIPGSAGGTGQTDGIRVEGGTLRLAHSNALGIGSLANVHVRGDLSLGAVLELDGSAGGVNLPANRNVVLIYADNYTSYGLYGQASAATGMLRSTAGSNSVAGTLDLRNIADNDNQGRIFVGVDSGTLSLAGAIFGTRNNANSDIRNNRDLIKVGPGQLELAGSTVNALTGNLAVVEGTLVLNKTPGVSAHSGTLLVGDNEGAAGSDVVILASSEQLPDAGTIVVAGSGQLQTNAAHAASLTNEVQQVQVGNAAPTGQFRLSFQGATTGDLAFGASLASIQAALNGLTTIGGAGGNVLVLGTGSGQNQAFTITFLGALAGTSQPQVLVVSGTTPYAGATLAVTTLTQGGLAGWETVGPTTLRMAPQASGSIALGSGSTFVLNGDVTVDNFGAVSGAAPTTTAISGGTLALQRQSATGAALVRNFNITADGPGAIDLAISSTIIDGAAAGVSNLVKATGAASRLVLSGDSQHTGTTVAGPGSLRIENSNALGATVPSEVQAYGINNALGAASGQYSLTFNAATTVNLNANASADQVAAALNALPTIGGAGGSVSVVSVISGNTGVQYVVRFGGALDATDVAQLSVNAGTLAGGASVVAGSTLQGGGLANIAASQTVVNNTGALELDSVAIVNEQLTLNNTGVFDSEIEPSWNNGAHALSGAGALRNIGGNSSWNGTAAGFGNVVLNTNPTTIGADAGTTLTIGLLAGQNVISGTGSLLKHGAGILELGGAVSNTYSGSTYINEGTLRLNKQGAAVAIAGGEIVVGNSLGGDNADVLLYASSAGSNQIGDRIIRIASSGLFDLNGVSDTINASINLDVGTTYSADVATGSGVLTNNATMFVVNNAQAGASTAPAVVAGRYDLNGGTRTIDVRKGDAPVELDLQAAVQVTGSFGITKGGRGTLALSGNNTYAGTTTLNSDAGTLLANTPATVAASAYTVNPGSTLGGVGTITGPVTLAAIGSNLMTGGVLNPGPSSAAPSNTGILTVNNNVSFNAGSLYLADINGTVAGSEHDQLLIGGAGTLTITGNAAPAINNTAMINGTLGAGFLPVNGADSFKLISKTSAGSISLGANSFLSQVLPPLPLASPAAVNLGEKTYTTTYNVVDGLNDGNDFVLQAVAATRVWDGRVDGGAVNVSNNWTLASNWQGDQAPLPGDDVVFDDLGLSNGKNLPFNNFVAGFDVRTVTFANTSGAYVVSGNSLTLAWATGGVVSDNGANLAVANTLNVPLFTSDNAQSITVKDGSTLTLGGAIAIGAAGPIQLTNGVGGDALGTLLFSGAIDGPGDLSMDLVGDATFSAPVGSTIPLGALSVVAVDDLTFANTLVSSGNVNQLGGTGTTTLSGGSVGGQLSITNESILLNGISLAVVGPAQLTASVGAISDGNGIMSNLTAPTVVLTAATGIGLVADPLEMTVGNLEATTSSGGIYLANSGALTLGGISAMNGVAAASGDIALSATGLLTVSEQVNAATGNIGLQGSGINFTGGIAQTGVAGSVSLNAGTAAIATTSAAVDVQAGTLNAIATTGIDLDTAVANASLSNSGVGSVTIDELDALNLLSLLVSSGAAAITSGGTLTNSAGAALAVSGNGAFAAPAISLGNQVGDNLQFGSLTFNSAGAVNIAEDGALQLAGSSTANSLLLNASGAMTNTAGASLTVAANASFNAPGINLGNQASDAFHFGTLTFASTGAVLLSEDSGTQFAGVNSADTLILVSTGVLTNVPAASLLVAGNAALQGATIDVGSQAGDSIQLGSLTFVSAGGVTVAEDSSLQVAGTNTALSLVLSAVGSMTNASAANVSVSGNTSFSATSIALGNQAGDVVNFGSLTFAASAGGVLIEENSALDLLGASSATAAIVLTSVDALGAGQNLTIQAGASVQSTGSSVTLNAGDDAFVTGNVTAATTVTVNVDQGNADAGVGGVVTITGVITTPAVGGGAFLTGDVDDDEFNFAPQATTAFDVNGDLPFGTPTGDTLNLDITGATAASLTLGGIGAGSWSFTPATLRSVVYTSIEDVNANGQYHLVLDASATSFGNTGIDDYLTLRRSGTDFVLERTGDLNLPNDAVGIVFTGDFATILSFTYLGSNDNDVLTISDVGGLVDFAGTVPGVTDNGNLAGTAEFLFDGNGGSDRLVFDLTGASAAQSYAIGTGTAAGLEGEVSSTSGGTTLISYFQDVELAQRTGVGATPGSLTIIGDASANGFTTAANGALTRTSATGYTPFEFSGNNFTEITINALGGADSLDLESLGTGQTNHPTITLDGGSDADTIRAQSTSGNTGDLNLIGGSGNDVFELYSTANTVDGLAGPVDVDGTDGNAGGNLDRLVIIDSGDGSGDDVLIEAVDAATSEDYVITGLGPVTSSVTFRSIDDLQYTGTSGNDTIDAQFVATTPLHDLNTVILAGFNGADQFLLFTSDQLGGTSPTPTPAPSGLSSITLLGGDGFDTFGETPTGLTDTGAMDVGLVVPDSTRMIRPSLSTAIVINGGPPSVALPTGDTIGDVLNLDISDLPDTLPVVVASGTVNIPGAPLAFAPLTWTDIEDLNLVDDGVLTNVQVGDLFGRMTDANDLVQFSRLNGVNQVRMRVNNWSGVYTVPGKTIVYGRGGIDHITQANLFNPAVFYGEDGNDVLTGASNNDWLVGGAGNDRISGAEGTNVLWGDDAPTSTETEPQDVDGLNDGDDNLSAGLGNDVFYGGGGNDLVNAGGGNDYVHGGWGNDNLAGVAGDDRLYGGEGDDVLSGYLGNDLLSGGAGNDRLYGQTGNDVIIGGDGEDMLVGDTGNDLLITGMVANEHSTWSSQAPTSTFSAATYSDPGDHDAALLNLLLQWGSASNSSLLGSITHDGDDDDVAGYTGADDFCWEAADLLDQPGATTPSDFNAPSMGPDERFGPT